MKEFLFLVLIEYSQMCGSVHFDGAFNALSSFHVTMIPSLSGIQLIIIYQVLWILTLGLLVFESPVRSGFLTP